MEEAWRQVQKSFAYTNHTVMAEAWKNGRFNTSRDYCRAAL
jgi:glucan phosphorylase